MPRARVGLAEPSDPAKLLHHAVIVLGAKLIVRDSDGYPSEPLAGRFKKRIAACSSPSPGNEIA